MDLTRRESAGTDFTFFTTVSGIVMVIAGGGSMAMAGLVGYVPALCAAAALCAVGVPVAVGLLGRLVRVDQRAGSIR